jgi:hypothetical protein
MKDDEIGGSCSMYGNMKAAYKILASNSVKVKPLCIPRQRYEDIIKMVLNDPWCKFWNRFAWLRRAAANEIPTDTF